MSELEDALTIVEKFSSQSTLTKRIAQIEEKLVLKDKGIVTDFLHKEGIEQQVLEGALRIKEISGQINVVVHALGILTALPYILDEDERIFYMSLGAGNTGKDFNLETNKRIAEFKFINWQGGSEAIRQNNLFIDFFNLSEQETNKRKCLYVIDKKHPLRFLNGGRAMDSVLSKNQKISDKFFSKYRDKYRVVSEYYRDFSQRVEIFDLRDFMIVF